jgi:hypothetical protein
VKPPRRCSIEGCDELVLARGWCEAHYDRWRRYGDPTAGMRPAYDLEETRRRLARGLEPIRDPVALARRYLASRRLLGGRDEEDLMDVAIDAIMSAAIAWEPDGGRSILSWAWLYMDRNVGRELGRCVRRRAELGRADQLVEGDWLRFNPGFDEYHQVELRLDLQRWADLAELTPLMRFVVEWAALHHGTILRFTPLQGSPTPLHGSGCTTFKLAVKHMRQAAITGRRRDDRWTRARAVGGEQATLARSNRVLAELRANEAAVDEQLAG